MITTTNLTRGERLLIARRREGSTAADCAAGCGVSLYRYKRWENDQEQGPTCSLGRLEPHEGLLILRRRAGLTGAELARRVGISPYWLSRVETGQAPASRLEAYWRDVVGA